MENGFRIYNSDPLKERMRKGLVVSFAAPVPLSLVIPSSINYAMVEY